MWTVLICTELTVNLRYPRHFPKPSPYIDIEIRDKTRPRCEEINSSGREWRPVEGSKGGRCIDGKTVGYRFAAPVFLRRTAIERGERKGDERKGKGGERKRERVDAGSRIYFRGALTRVSRDGNRRKQTDGGRETAQQRDRGRGEFMCLERVKGTRVATSAAESYSWMQQGVKKRVPLSRLRYPN